LSPVTLPELRINSYDISIRIPDPFEQNIGSWRDAKGNLFAIIQIIKHQYWIHWINIASFHLNLHENVVSSYVFPEIKRELVDDIFQRNILPYYLHLAGLEVLHASAVRSSMGVVGFCANSGSGKSTLAYALSKQGKELWCDDALVISTSPTPPTVFKIPFYVRLLPDTYKFFLDGKYDNQQLAQEVLPYPRTSTNEIKIAELSKIIIMERIGKSKIDQIDVIPLSPVQAFPNLIKHAYTIEIEEDVRKKRMLENYIDLTSKISVYKIKYPSNLNRIADLVDEILDLI